MKKLAAGCTNLAQEIANAFRGDKLKVKLGSVEISLPAIQLTPLGKNASAYLNSLEKTKASGLRLIQMFFSCIYFKAELIPGDPRGIPGDRFGLEVFTSKEHLSLRCDSPKYNHRWGRK